MKVMSKLNQSHRLAFKDLEIKGPSFVSAEEIGREVGTRSEWTVGAMQCVYAKYEMMKAQETQDKIFMELKIMQRNLV
jgi:hypothetical protein